MRIPPSLSPLKAPSLLLRPSGLDGAQAARKVAGTTAGVEPKALDGKLLGGDGKAYPANTPYTQVPPTRPSNGKHTEGTILFVNGMGETPSAASSQARHIADTTGMQVVNLYNATEGVAKDLLQATGDTFDLGTNKAVDSLADQVYDRLMAGESIRLMSHSQGGLITSRALTDVRNRMVAEGGLTRKEAEAKLANVGVETLGSAAPSWPDGPKYVHYVNRSDFVPTFLGVGRPFTDPGKDAKVITFGRFNPFGGWFGGDGHNSTTYLAKYVPFAEASKAR
jgi:hypothetical protein